MIGDKKYFLLIAIVLILISIGGVWASDNSTTDSVAATDSGSVAVDDSPALAKDTSVKENLTVENNDEPASAADSKSGEVLGASNDEDVLGAASLPDTISSSQTFNAATDYNIASDGTKINFGTSGQTIVIDGKNNTFHGGKVSMFIVNTKKPQATLIFRNMIFTDANLPTSLTYGGGFVRCYNPEEGMTFTFENCKFYHCNALVGGAISVIGTENTVYANINIINCYFEDNNATKTGTTNSGGGAVKCEYVKSVYVENSCFKGCNVPNSARGGALFLNRISGDIEIVDCNFTNNFAEGGAGIGFSFIEDNQIIISGCNFKENTAVSQGGAIRFPSTDHYLKISNTNFTNNSASTGGAALFNLYQLELDNCQFIDNSADIGGAFYTPVRSGSLEIKNNCLFSNNDITNGNGSTIYTGVGSVTISDSIFKESDGATYGGAIYFANNLTSLSIDNSDFIDNSATDGGGAIYITNSTSLEIKNGCLFSNNDITSGNGAAIYAFVTSATISDSTFKDSDGATNGGAIYFANGLTSLTINENSKFINNNASNQGGAIFINPNSKDITLTDCEFDKNTALSGGAIIFYAGSSDTGYSNININSCDFTNNNATQSNDGGSAITFMKVTTVNFDDCTFDNNVATNYGTLYFADYKYVTYTDCTFSNNNAGLGAAAYYRGSSYRTNATYSNCIFKDNTATDGGVIYNTGENLNIKGSNFTNNTAIHYGGVIYTTGNYLYIDNSTFEDNDARPVDVTQRANGGVLYIIGNHVSVTNSNFTNNFAWAWGGAIIMGDEDSNHNLIGTDDLEVINCRFIDNKAYNAAAIDTYGTSNAHVINSTFEYNEAGQQGGALYMTGAYGRIDGCNFTGNKAINGSAIIYIPPPVGVVDPTAANITNCRFTNNIALGIATVWSQSSQGKIMYCDFTNNTAKSAAGIYINIDSETISYSNFTDNNATDGDGGAIYITSASDSTQITNSKFSRNHADKGNGGAIYFVSSSGSISTCDFINNTAKNGGAIVLANNGQTISDCYFLGNNATAKGGAVYALAQTGLNISDSRFIENNADNGGAVYYQGTNTNGLQVYNDTFIGNIAEFNGGAVYYRAYLNGAYVPLSDYNYFNNHAGLDAGTDRISGKGGFAQAIVKSYFENNIDYLMNATASADGLTAYVSITVPQGARRSSNTDVVVNVTVVGEDGISKQVSVTFESQTDDGDNVIIKYRLNTTDLEEGKYNATVGFKKTDSPNDDLYLYKEDKVNFTLKNPFQGDFEQLQNLINEVLYNATQGLPAVLNLTRDYNFTEMWDIGPLKINGTITINGNGYWIDAKGHTRIFDITADDVVLNDIIIKNGNANGDNSTSYNKLQGGAILLEGNNCEINNCTFENNVATEGGAIFIQHNATGTSINNSTFTNNGVTTTTTTGGAVYINATGCSVEGSEFNNNHANAAGAIYVDNVPTEILNSTFTSNGADSGAAIYVQGSTNFLINDAKFNSNEALTGGAVVIQSSTGNIANSSFTSNQANDDDCAGISIIGSNDVNVSSTTFSGNTADIYVGLSNDVLLYNLTISNSGTSKSSPIYIYSDVTIDDLSISNWNSGNAIEFAYGNSTVSDSAFDGANPIKIDNNVEVHLTGVNNTNNLAGDYSVINNGILYLDGNNFENIINNAGNIKTNTTVKILNNQTIVLENNTSFKFNVTMFDDNNNTIKDSRLKLIVNGTKVYSLTSYNNGYYYTDYNLMTQGVYAISANVDSLGLDKVDHQTALIKVKTHDAEVKINITKINHGETVIIQANVTPLSATGNVTFFLEGIEYGKHLNYTVDINQTTGIATLTLKNLTQDTYRVSATYNGDDTHFPANSTESKLLIVFQLESNVQIKVNNTIQGQDVIAVITSNATLGNVSVTFNQVTVILPVDENGTAIWNLSANFTITSGSYFIQAYFNDNDYYKPSLDTTTFEVYEYDINIEVNETQYNQSATIKVTISPVEAQGADPTIYLDGVVLTNVTKIDNGTFIATSDILTVVGEHFVEVQYPGILSTIFYPKVADAKFNVTANRDYEFDVAVDDIKFGENATINITGPANITVTVSIDGKEQTVTLNENGTCSVTAGNLTAGQHNVIASFAGNENYTAKNTTTKYFNVNPATPDMTIDVTQPINPNDPANVTVNIGKNATGTVIIYIDGTPNVVQVKNGTAVLPLDTSKPGKYNVTAEFFSKDSNYLSASNETGTTYTVGRYNSTIDSAVSIDVDNHVIVTVNVTGASNNGNVTLVLSNGTNKTVNVENGVATFDLGIVDEQKYYNFTATFNGDENLNPNSTTNNFTVGGLRNYTLNVTISETQFGDNTTITVTMEEAARGGTVTVYVDDKPYTATQQLDGSYVVVTEALPVGNYTVNVTYTGNNKYAAKNSTNHTLTVNTNSSYAFDVVVTPAPFGENTTINITGPAGVNVTVSIDGVEQNVTLDENGTYVITLNNLTAGTHNVTAEVVANENYTSKDVTKYFPIGQATPSMNIIVPSDIVPAGGVANVTVEVGDNATGDVIIFIDGVANVVPIVNGSAVLPIDTTKAGTFNVTAKYGGDSNYAKAENNNVQNFTVNKYNITMTYIGANITDNNNVTFNVRFNETDVKGNVTITVAGKEYTGEVKDGIARINVGVLNQQTDEYEFNATYNGDDKYNTTAVRVNATVGKLGNGTMNITVSPTQFGDNTTITVNIPDVTDGNVTVWINNNPYNATETMDGVYEVVIPALPVGDYPITVNYINGSKYDNFNGTSSLSVERNSSYVFGVDVVPANYGENTTIIVTAPAGVKEVNVTVDGDTYLVPIDENGKGIKKLDNLTAGKHEVIANFTGNYNYTAKVASKTFDVNRSIPKLNITVEENVAAGSDVLINVTINDDATGSVNIIVDGKDNVVPIKDGKANVTVLNVVPGKHNITVNYMGDLNYNETSKDGSFHAGAYETKLNVTGFEADVNNNVTVIVKINDDATGNITITIGDKNYTAEIVNGTAKVNIGNQTKGPLELNVTYKGDENYNATKTTATINIKALVNYTLPMSATNIDYGANATVTVKLPEGANSTNLTFYVDGIPETVFDYNETTRVATLTIVNPTAGNHTVKAVYAEDNIYADNENSTSFNVASVVPSMNVVIDHIEVGETAVVNVTLPADAKGTVTVTVNGTKYTGDVVNGAAIVTIPNLGNGTHPVTVAYSGDDNYNSTSELDNITVNKVVPQVIVNTTNITLGDVAVINVTLPSDASGTVTVKVDGIEKTVPVIGGVNSIEIPGISVGTKDINVTYNGNDKYDVKSVADAITVNQTETVIEVIDTKVDENNNVTVVVSVPGANDGNVTIKIGNETYNATVVNGTAVVNVGKLDKGDYEINVTYSGDENHTSANITRSISVPALKNYTLPMNTTDVAYGANATVTVKLPEGANSTNLTFYVDGTPVTAFDYNETTRVATLTIVNPTAGEHTVKVTYAEDDIYADLENSTSFNVANVEPSMNVVINPIEVGETAVVNVTLPADAKGTVTVTVNGTKYTADVVNGTAVVSIPNLGNGTYDVNITYNGDGNYDSVTNLTSLVVSKVDPQVMVNTSDITLGDVAVINVTLPSDATGTVTVKVDGIEKTVPIIGGLNSIEIPGITVGTKDINVTYNGDNKYLVQSVTDKNITVNSVVTEIISIEPEIDDNNNVTVVVKVPEAATGNVTVKIGNETYTADVVDGVAKVNIGVQPKGTHDINVTYNGDENYTSANNITPIDVPALVNYTLLMNTSDIAYGANATVTVNLPAGAKKENLTFYVDGVATKDFEFDNATGVATLTIVNPTAGDHTVKVTYDEDDIYASKENSTSFSVASVEPSMNVVMNPIEVGETAVVNVTLPEDAKGTVTVTVDGTKYTADVVNGTAVVSIPKLGNGTYDVNITYSGDDNYNSVTNLTSLVVSKVDPQVMVNTSDITLGDVAVINVTLPSDATGTVTVKVDGIEKTVPVTGGLNSIEIPGITVGTKDINVTYNGDDKYAVQSVTDKNITVNSVVTEIESITTEIDDNNNVTVVVKVPEAATGNVTVKIGNETYTANVTDGVAKVNIGVQPKGTHDINVTYNGDENYTSANNITPIDVPALVNYTLPMNTSDIAYGANATVTVNLPAGAKKENLTFYVDGVATKDFEFDNATGVATLTIVNPTAGDHTVKVTYDEDDIYADNENSTSFSVASVKPSMNVEMKPIDVGETAVINVTLPKDASGSITVEVDGTKYTADVVNGVATVSIPKLGNGTHPVNITYNGDGNYDPITKLTTLTVSKIDPEIKATTADITLGENAVINVTLPSDATGTVTVKIGDITKTVGVTGGENSIIVSDVPVGTYDNVEVTYNGDDKYLADTTTVKMTVNPKPTKEDEIKVIDNGDGTITVIVPDNATGDITVTIGNETLPPATIVDGKAVIDLTNSSQKPGKHNITVAYSGDENHTAVVTNSTGVIPKWDSSINATVATIREGDNAVITVEVTPKDATGSIKVDIDGIGYFADIQDGKAVITVPGLKEGVHDVKATYDGDDYYNGNTTSTQVTVQAPIKVDVNGTGNSSQVVIQLPKDHNGTVDVLIDDKPVRYTIENDTVKVNLTGIEPGEHNMTVIYTDADGTQSVVNTTIIVPRWDSSVSASAKTIREGDVANIVVKVGSADMTGRVLVDINGTGYYADIVNGEVTIQAPGLKAGTYNANVTFEGNAKYDPSNNTFQVVVEAPIVIYVNGTGNNSQVVIDLPANGTDNVTVKIDGNEIPVDVSNGTAVANLTGIEPGEHVIEVIYTDADGTQSIVNTTISVPRWDSSVSASANTIREGDIANIVVKVGAPEMDGLVFVDIGGIGYYANITSGEVTIQAPGLKSGTYKANVTYYGNEKYDPSNNTFELVVEAPIVINIEGAGNSTKVVVDLPANGTDNVTVMVDGKPVNVTIVNGTAVAELDNITAGEHNISVTYVDKDGNPSYADKTINVFNSINAENMSRGWNSPYDFEAEFLDKEGHVLANSTVTFKVDGQTYKVTTDDKGIGKLDSSHLNVGVYEVEIINDATGETITRNTTIVKRLIDNKDKTLDFRDGTQYVVRAIGDDGLPVGAGEVVGITINKVDYITITDEDGYAKLTINLNPKSYVLVAQYAGFKVSNKIVVKQTLKLVKKTVTVKKSAKSFKLKATLKWTNGKAIKGKKVTFTFKGKKYVVKTDSKGLAQVTINKSVIKTLTAGKKYAYSVSYYSNTVKGQVNVKK